jgi:tetratricopeptide (TPR) repeat protein
MSCVMSRGVSLDYDGAYFKVKQTDFHGHSPLASLAQISQSTRLMTNNRTQWHILIAPVMGGMALFLYIATLSRGPFPGESANLMASALGMNPLGASGHILWSWLVKFMETLPFGTVSFRLNLLSALCAGGAVALFFRLLADTVWMVIPVTELNVRAANRASVLAGLAGSLALMGAMPFWYAANRFHPAAFDMLVLFMLARLFLRFARQADVIPGLVLALLYGVFVVEFATLIVFGPLVLFGVLYALWSQGELRWGRVLSLAGCLAVGLLAYIPAAWQLQGTPAFQISSESGFWTALYMVIKGQYVLIARGLPQLGWLLVIIVGIVPWLAILVVARRGLNEERDKGLYILHVILTVVVLAALFNAPFAPWSLIGPGHLLVTPYALLAFTFGYLTAYWMLFPRLFNENAEEDETGKRWMREHGGFIPAGLLLGAAVAAGTLNFPGADARPAGAVNEYAREVVRATAGHDWLVTDGVLDGNIQVASRELGVPLQCFNLQQGNNTLYMQCLVRSFDAIRLKTLAEVDGVAFLRGWMESDVQFDNKVAFLGYPDLWMTANLQPVPSIAVFTGVRAVSELDPGALWARHEAFWKSPFISELQSRRRDSPMLEWVSGYILRHLSMVANNLGVVLEDLAWQQQAYGAYAQARNLDTNNISAMLNQLTLVQNGFKAPDADIVKAGFAEFTKTLKQKLQIWSLSRVYGYVRMPEAYANLGMTWAYSGQPGMAVAGYKRAIELAPDRKDQLSQGLAMAYLAQEQTSAGEEILRGLLEKEPGNVRIILALSRLAAQKSRFDEASALLDRALKAGVSKDRIALEYGVMHLAAGEPGKARVIFQELVDLHPDLLAAWSMLAAVLMQQNDMKALEECERKLSRAKGHDFMTTVIMSEISLRRLRFTEARTYIDQALGMRPNTPVLLDMLLRLDVQEGRRDLAGVHIRALLLQDSGHPYANQVLASLQLERKEYAQAENSLRKSLERKRDPGVLNDLAWVLAEIGEFDKAEELVLEALKLNDKIGTAWDTLAVILMKRGKLPEAGDGLKKALALAPDNPYIQVHLAQYYEKTGKLAKAVELADSLLAHPVGLSLSEQNELRRIGRSANR